MSRRHPMVGLSLYGVIFVNALSHLGAFVRAGYNPGALTALILFIPISIWVARVCFGKHGLRYGALVFIVADGVILHIILVGSAILFLHGGIGASALTAIQISNAILFFLLAWLAERWGSGRFARVPVFASR